MHVGLFSCLWISSHVGQHESRICKNTDFIMHTTLHNHSCLGSRVVRMEIDLGRDLFGGTITCLEESSNDRDCHRVSGV